MNHKKKLLYTLRYTLLLAIIILGLVAIIGTGGSSDNGSSNGSDNDSSKDQPTDTLEINWNRTSNLLFSYNYTDGFLTSGTANTGFEVTDGSGEVEIAVEHKGRKVSGVVFVEEGESYKLAIRVGLSHTNSSLPGTYEIVIDVTSPSAERPANVTLKVSHGLSVGNLLGVKVNGESLGAVVETKMTRSLHGVTWGGDQFVTVGLRGTIGTSPDGINWTVRDSGTSEDLFGITWGGSQFVAVGEDGTILTSPDGIAWTARDSGTSANLLGITYGDDQFAAMGTGGTILTSHDGVRWTERSSGTTHSLRNVVWDGSKFVAVGGDSGFTYYRTDDRSAWGDIILTSPNGMEWIERYSEGSEGFTGVAWSGQRFVVVGPGGAVTSMNGVTWTQVNTDLDSILSWSHTLKAVVWGEGRFVAVGSNVDIVTSLDGMKWTKPDTRGDHLNDVTMGNDRFVAVGNRGESLIQISPDGLKWERLMDL